MLHRHQDRIHILHVIHGLEFDAIEMLRFLGVCLRIHHDGCNSIFPKLLVNINNLGVSGIRAVFLKGKSENRNSRMLHRKIIPDQELHQALCTVLAHVVVDSSSGQNDL